MKPLKPHYLDGPRRACDFACCEAERRADAYKPRIWQHVAEPCNQFVLFRRPERDEDEVGRCADNSRDKCSRRNWVGIEAIRRAFGAHDLKASKRSLESVARRYRCAG